MALLDSGGGGGSDDGSSSTDDTTSTNDGTMVSGTDSGGVFNLTKEKVLGVLGIGAGTWATLTEFATDPLGFILETILPWIVGGILDGWSVVLGAFMGAWEPLTTIPSSLTDPLGAAGGAILGPVLGLIATLNDSIVSLAQSAGPFAPVVVAGIWIGIGAALSASLNAIPIVGTTRTALGVISS